MPQESSWNVEEREGSKYRRAWWKQEMQGRHYVHVRSLPVSSVSCTGCGGVPMPKCIRYSMLGLGLGSLPLRCPGVRHWGTR